jgi:hypothetical protein
MYKYFSILLILLIQSFSGFTQSKVATLNGIITDANNNKGLYPANVYLKGTMYGAQTDEDGKYQINNIPPGEYSVEVSSVGFERQLFTAYKFIADEKKELSISLSKLSVTGREVKIIGEKPLIDVDNGKTQKNISRDVIDAAPVKNIQNILNSQTGVVQNAEGIHIRGGRTYETGFYIDGVSATDPLAGTGFGIDLGTNAMDNVEVTTGGIGVEYGDATAGVVNAETRAGKDKLELSYTHKQDNLGFNKKWNGYLNQSINELNLGGSIKIPKTAKKLRVFTSFKNIITDDYYHTPADQLKSSIYPDKNLSPRQDNRWAASLKLNYDFSPKKKLTFSYVKSLNINQDVNMLRITGNDVSFTPGYQYPFAQMPDNANTYTHDTNLETLSWFQLLSKQFSYKLSISRLYVHLRADANGRPWRPDVVNSELNPASITSFPTTTFNPNDSIVFVNSPSGFYNNNGIATLWHDHFVEEYTMNGSGTFYSKNSMNKITFGFQHKQQDMQWIDIYSPWVGAPIQLNNGSYSQSYRLGDISDIWHVQPAKGAIYANEHFKYLGLIADAGIRTEYWFPGKFVDDAIANSSSPIRDEVRANYLAHTIGIGDRRVKLRMLPKVSASFPIKENQVMYFNYGHTTVAPHPSYIYTGLDPYYADRSTLSKLGNPDINPEVDISYELGLKSQLTSNDALNIAAFWKDKYDFITAVSLPVKDVTGREVFRTIQINSDYARVRGLEAAYIKRIKKWFEGQVSVSYSVATGQSSSSSDVLKDIISSGSRQAVKETYLAWDSPWDIKTYFLFTKNSKTGFWGKKYLNKMSAYTELIYRSGRRYTPYIYSGDEPKTGRPIWVVNSDPNAKFSKLGTPSFIMNMNFKKWWTIKKYQIAFTVELTNALNNRNAQVVNPVTGKAYKYGDAVPTEWKDPMYNDPRDARSSLLSQGENPSRYNEPRHLLLGVSFKF